MINSTTTGAAARKAASTKSRKASRRPKARGTNGTPPPQPDGRIYLLEDTPIAETANLLGKTLAQASDDLFCQTGPDARVLLARPDGAVKRLVDPVEMMAVVAARAPSVVWVNTAGKVKGTIPSTSLKVILRLPTFLQHFREVDRVTRTPIYMPNFELVSPGWNDGGDDNRVLYLGPKPETSEKMTYITKFVDVMDFASEADRTNAVAAALTILLRHHWPGGKPVLVITATKSHSGKDCILQFARNVIDAAQISYQATNWAVEQSITRALNANPTAGVIHVGNARLDVRERFIASAVLERIATDPRPFLHSSARGESISCNNDFVLAITTNFGTVSEDLVNRSLPIHLTPNGDVLARTSPIGNPAHEFLPAHAEDIARELRGMVARWVAAGRKLAEYRHPFAPWAKTVGGILEANGFKGFLDNYGDIARLRMDPAREAIATVAASAKRNLWARAAIISSPHDQGTPWARAAEWAELVHDEGLTAAIISSPHDQGTPAARERGIGKAFTRYLNETFRIMQFDSELKEEKPVYLKLEKSRRRPEGETKSDAKVHYRFAVATRAAGS